MARLGAQLLAEPAFEQRLPQRAPCGRLIAAAALGQLVRVAAITMLVEMMIPSATIDFCVTITISKISGGCTVLITYSLATITVM
ncbi:hypothetical protein SD70_15090 [Gordoniibacillus kamchatkensis]|uniref:Uncharacterized protein n=1 Tax=Gordoniibacillus kamchatkensis TaxID=1590651 RepID=A0ABR5AGK0_9BACL|nr:hypothetical protein SD70_15090 [Paenibacillus sp. VKM B-2647]